MSRDLFLLSHGLVGIRMTLYLEKKVFILVIILIVVQVFVIVLEVLIALVIIIFDLLLSCANCFDRILYIIIIIQA